MTVEQPVDLTGRTVAVALTRVGRRISWVEFYKLRPDLLPANDNMKEAANAA